MVNNNNASLKLNLMELDILLRLLNQQQVSVADDNIFFLTKDASGLCGSISMDDYKRKINATPEADASSLMARVKYAQILSSISSVAGSTNQQVFACSDLYKKGDYLGVFVETFKSADKEAIKHCSANIDQLNHANFKKVVAATKRAMSNQQVINKVDDMLKIN